MPVCAARCVSDVWLRLCSTRPWKIRPGKKKFIQTADGGSERRNLNGLWHLGRRNGKKEFKEAAGPGKNEFEEAMGPVGPGKKEFKGVLRPGEEEFEGMVGPRKKDFEEAKGAWEEKNETARGDWEE